MKLTWSDPVSLELEAREMRGFSNGPSADGVFGPGNRSILRDVQYKRDLPAQPKNKVTLNLAHLTPGKYTAELFKVGYRPNDAYAAYKDLGSPAQLTRDQVAKIKSENCGAPLESHVVDMGSEGNFSQQFDLRENDVVLVAHKPQH